MFDMAFSDTSSSPGIAVILFYAGCVDALFLWHLCALSNKQHSPVCLYEHRHHQEWLVATFRDGVGFLSGCFLCCHSIVGLSLSSLRRTHGRERWTGEPSLHYSYACLVLVGQAWACSNMAAARMGMLALGQARGVHCALWAWHKAEERRRRKTMAVAGSSKQQKTSSPSCQRHS